MGDAVKVVNISKKYKGVVALDHVSLTIKKNSIFGLLGSNGAGKSTLLHIIIGLLNPNEGDVYVLDEKINKGFSKNLKNKVAIVPQKLSLYEELTIFENLYFFAKSYGLPRKEVLEKIEGLKNILRLGDLHRKVKNLSGGYQRRTSLAVGLIGSPEILILDEATVGIDLETKKIINELLLSLKEHMTVITTTHSLEEAEAICDYVYFLHKGKKVLEGTLQDIIKKYSAENSGDIHIVFKDEEAAKKIFDLFGETKILRMEGNKLYLVSFSGQYSANVLTNFLNKIKGYEKDIVDISIHKPNLEEIMLQLIKSD